MENETKEFEEYNWIETIIVRGSGDILFKDDGTIVTDSKISCDGTTLTFKANSSGTINIRSVYTGSHITGSGSNITIGNSNFVNIVSINGKRIDLSKYNDEEKETKEPKKIYKLGKQCNINYVSVAGSASIGNIPSKFVGDIFVAKVSGSGTIVLPQKTFLMLNVNVGGSGDVDGDGETFSDTLNAELSGSGDITGIHIKQTGKLHLNGSGDIKVTATTPENVEKYKSGSGSIKVYRLKI